MVSSKGMCSPALFSELFMPQYSVEISLGARKEYL